VNSNLAKNSLFTLFANLSLALSNWLLLIIIAKQFSGQFLGEFILALSITTPVFLFFSFKLRTVIIIDTSDNFSLEKYVNARFLANLCALLISLLIGYYFFPSIPFSLFLLLGLYKWADSWSELSYSYFHKFDLFSFASFSQATRSTCSILILLIASSLYPSATLTIALWVLITFIFAFFDLNKMVKHNMNNKNKMLSLVKVISSKVLYINALILYKKHLTLSVSLVIGALFVYIPNFFIEHYQSVTAAGQFASISYFLIAGGIVITSISQAALPRLTNILSSHSYQKFIRLTFILCIIGAGIGLAGLIVTIAGGKFILAFVYNNEISTQHTEMVWVMAAAAIRYIYIFIGTAMNALKQFHAQTKIYISGTISLLFLCLWLVPIESTVGAAKAMMIATCVELLGFIITFIFQLKIIRKEDK